MPEKDYFYLEIHWNQYSKLLLPLRYYNPKKNYYISQKEKHNFPKFRKFILTTSFIKIFNKCKCKIVNKQIILYVLFEN